LKRYACSYGTYPNGCPTCDTEWWEEDLKFFVSVKDYADYAWENSNDFCLGLLYDLRDLQPVAGCFYAYGFHRCGGLKVKDMVGKELFCSEDDGHGNTRMSEVSE
jgi:hypothetical protein